MYNYHRVVFCRSVSLNEEEEDYDLFILFSRLHIYILSLSIFNYYLVRITKLSCSEA